MAQQAQLFLLGRRRRGKLNPEGVEESDQRKDWQHPSWGKSREEQRRQAWFLGNTENIDGLPARLRREEKRTQEQGNYLEKKKNEENIDYPDFSTNKCVCFLKYIAKRIIIIIINTKITTKPKT